jgi:hypothetical protein
MRMLQQTRMAGRIAIFLLAAVAATRAFADGGAAVERADTRPPAIHVAEEFSGSITPGCAYHARVNGTLQPEKAGDDTKRFRPDLRVETWVDCASSPRHDVTRLRGAAITSQTLEFEIERRAIVGIRHAGVVCVIAPEIRFDGSQLDAGEIHGICRRPPNAVGGGPAWRGSEIEGVTRL